MTAETDYSKMTKEQLRAALEERDATPAPQLADELPALDRLLDTVAAQTRTLADLARRAAPDTRTLDERIAAVQLELEDVPRRGHAEITGRKKDGGTFTYSYDYLTEPDLMKGIRPLLAKHGVATYYSDRILSINAGLATVEVTLTFAANGEERLLTTQGLGTDTGDKGANKAKTSAVRYLLWKTFLQPSDEDDPEQENVSVEEAAKAHADRERTAALRAGDSTRRTTAAAAGDRTGDLMQRISQRSIELDEVHGLAPGATLGRLQQLARETYDGAELAGLDQPTIVKIGQALANHLATEREAYERDGLNFTPTEFRLPD